VRRPWRRQGLARALIARSLHVLRERGMDHAALGVDAENPNGALQLYRSMGFQVVKVFTTYRKPLADGS
jgi:ribosomal protein S18 acetylase RimI-like enzyme